MKIRAKLLVLLFASIVAAVLSIATYFVMIGPVELIQNEQVKFQRLENATQQIQIELNRLAVESFGSQIKTFQTSLDAFNAATGDLDTATVLPTLNESIAKAIGGVKNLHDLLDPAVTKVKGQFDQLQQDSELLLSSRDTGTIATILNTAKDSGRDDAYIFAFHVTAFLEGVKSLQQVLSVTTTGFENTDALITTSIHDIRDRSTLVSFLALGAILIVLFILSVSVARSITGALGSVHGRLASMSTGDLRGRFNLRSRDEIGLVAKHLNSLLEMLHDSIGHTKRIALENVEIKDKLVSAVQTATTSAVQIDANTDSIRMQVENMDRMIQDSDVEIKRLAGSAEQFDQRISNQNRHIEESVSAVTQMIASLENITRITDRDRESAASLVRESDEGRGVFEDSFEKIAGISSQVDLIQEMATVIANVASQTNILAMNAAIEAAHAGEYGKGFAVVADEIGKLAAESAASSAEIAQSIRGIVDSVAEAASTRQATSQAFESIQDKIKDVSDSITEIHQNIREMQVGSRQAIEAMESLRANSSSIVDESKKMDSGTQVLAGSFAKVTRVSHEMAANITEIATGLREINRSIHDVSGHASRIGELGQQLAESVDRFATDDEIAAGAIDGAAADGDLEILSDGGHSDDQSKEKAPVALTEASDMENRHE